MCSHQGSAHRHAVSPAGPVSQGQPASGLQEGTAFKTQGLSCELWEPFLPVTIHNDLTFLPSPNSLLVITEHINMQLFLIASKVCADSYGKCLELQEVQGCRKAALRMIIPHRSSPISNSHSPHLSQPWNISRSSTLPSEQCQLQCGLLAEFFLTTSLFT